MTASETFQPRIRPLGFDGLLVSFGDRLTEPANRAALAFRAALDGQDWPGMVETSATLVSAYLRFDPLAASHAETRARLQALLDSRDWLASALPEGRKLVVIPCVYGGDHGPQLAEAAALAGMSEAEAIRSLSTSQVQVQAIGFAPGQPYLGNLPEAWNIPRQEALTPTVDPGALVVAIRQFVLFAVKAPTGWRKVGQTAFRLFRPDSDTPFVLRPGDEVRFRAVDAESFLRMSDDPDGGATFEALP